MSEAGTPDISRIIELIMNNPQLIEQISALARQSEAESVEPTAAEAPSPSEPEVSEAAPASVPLPPPVYGGHREARSQLLCALKPYVSKERAKAIDSMISIANIFDVMKAR